MGFDVNRFAGEVNPDLICTICSDVFEDPVQTPICEHYFCRKCITSWLKQTPTCPIDRQHLTESDLKDAPRIVRSFLSGLKINCSFTSKGCGKYVKVDSLEDHSKGCEFNPEAVVNCSKGCGAQFKRRLLSSHECLTHLLDIVKDLETVRNLLEAQGKEKDMTIERLETDIEAKQGTIDQMRVNQQKMNEHLIELTREEDEMEKNGKEREAQMRREQMEREAKVTQLQDLNKSLLVGNETLRADNQRLRNLLDAKQGDESQFKSKPNVKPNKIFESLRVTNSNQQIERPENGPKCAPTFGPFSQTTSVKPHSIFGSLKVFNSLLNSKTVKPLEARPSEKPKVEG